MRSIYAAGKTEFISSISWPTGSLLLQTMSSLGFLDLQQQLSLKLRSPVLSGAGAWGPSWPRSGPALLRGVDDQSAGCGTDYSLSRRPAGPLRAQPSAASGPTSGTST